jgi:ribonuclease HII
MQVVIGIDEVGRGAWAGPLLVAAVRLRAPIAGLKDSKLLSRLARDRLAAKITPHADIGFGWVEPKLIDKYGLAHALRLGCKLALANIEAAAAEQIVIDGKVNFAPRSFRRVIARVAADQTIAAVSAASIVAKVARDVHMHQLALDYPAYGFEKHVGYGTLAHQQALSQHGPCPQHRFSFRPMSRLAEASA